MGIDWGDVPTWLGVVGAVIEFILGRAEYRLAQQWTRSEFLAAEVDRFFANPRVATALLLVDYSAIKWKPPDFYEAVAGFVKAYQYGGAAHLFAVFGHRLRA